MIALVVLLATPPQPVTMFVQLGYVLLYVSALMTLWSMVLYLRAAWPSLMSGLEREDP
jgi:CDP-diacylglycerol--glycerol-3-phosphate 3-phosphatidyltransferase